jgi:hypothetical protein
MVEDMPCVVSSGYDPKESCGYVVKGAERSSDEVRHRGQCTELNMVAINVGTSCQAARTQ